MRHGKKVNHLSRKAGHRRALMSNMASSLIRHKRIQTTLAKAKSLRQYLEPLVTKAKDNTTHSRRVVFSYLQDKYAVQELFDTIAAKVGDRPGGYLRIIRVGFRQGDAADMALIEFVDFNETYTLDKKERAGGAKKRTRRGRKGKGEGEETGQPEAAAAPAKAEAPVAEAPAAVAEAEAEEPEVLAEAEDTAAEAAGEETASEEDSENKEDTTA